MTDTNLNISDYIDDDDLDNTEMNNLPKSTFNIALGNVKRELKKNDITFNFFRLKMYENNLLYILYDSKCDSKEYIEDILKQHNKTYDNSIFSLLNMPIIFNYIFSRYGNYGINGVNISSFIQCCNMDLFYLAKLISNMLYLSKKDIKSIFSQCCINLLPKYAQLLSNINEDACREVTNDGIILDNIMKSLKKYLDGIQNNILKNDLVKNKEIEFDKLIKLFTNLNYSNIYFYKHKILFLNDDILNISLVTLNINKSMYLRSKKIENLDKIDFFSDIEKVNISKIPVKDDLCVVCYEKKPNIVTFCKHQYCNSCMSMLLLKVMPCPICRCIIDIDNLYCISTDIRKLIHKV
jgi:hypothetical protein